MYALVNGQELILGPIAFNYRMINYELEELEVDFRVTSQSYQSVPIIITDEIRIISARNEIPNYDPKFQAVAQYSHEIKDTEVVFYYQVNDKPLDQIKAEYKLNVKPERQRKENTIISVELGGGMVDVSTSRDTRIALMSKMLGNEGPYNYKFDNGSWREVTKSDIETLISQIDSKVQEAFDWELAKLQEIDACVSGEEVYRVEIIPQPELIMPRRIHRDA